MIGLIILFLIAFALSAFFAGSEMAYISSNKLKAKHLAGTGSRSARLVLRFQRDPKWVLSTLLIGYNLAHVTLTSLFAYVMMVQFGIHDEWIVTLLLAPFIIIFAETVPKDWFRQKADDFIYRIAPVLLFFEWLFYPILKLMVAITDFFTSLMPPSTKRSLFVTKDELRYMVSESAREGVLHEHEKQLINTILDLRSISVEEVMTPLKPSPKLELARTVGDAKRIARQSKEPFILIYEEIPSLVVGIVYVFDILFEEDLDKGIGAYLHAPLFIPQNLSVEKAIFLLQSKHSSSAAVTNEANEVVGVVDIENLIRF